MTTSGYGRWPVDVVYETAFSQLVPGIWLQETDF